MLTRARWGTTAVWAALLVTLGLGLTGTPAQAAPEDDGATAPKPQQSCTFMLDKLRPGQQVSKVVSSACSTDASSAALTCYDPLATFYEDVNYGGYRYTFCGYYGTCDAAGYGFRNMGGFVPNTASAFRVYGGCTFMRLYDLRDFGGANITYYGSRSWVGSTFNDRTESFRVWHG